ncbi:MAG: hypoxanthine phosphoribosyltransferase [Spirochaetes bacterium]|nr:hypoxanthine phosphoribosyltransferase [Spirochaetota bacterium]
MKHTIYYKKLGKIIISQKRIQRKIKDLAREISDHYSESEVVLICNLKGSFRFLSDLSSYLTIPTIMDFVAFSSYDGVKSEGKIRIVKDLKIDISGRHVLIIEDIIDTGITVDYLIKYLEDFKKPKDIQVCVLLDKPSKRKVVVPIHFKGFEIEDIFVVGYGLDYKEYFRELNDIRVYNE